ncbi:sulfite exporter TauE/SafE family protein [bacterium]|nr:sulfite exporter TauE/SafE family protein [bacterium]NCQ54742.1 sulfite exporter TauE/SafE family protein [Candidatus Parcubacteria bacterium]NCS67995.1 sulfite exporter TauE/SafE family protein [Candidatus Peregrinibacteria bacterium]NCS95732.1 sulfite exporter TauE/SafE family protein [bacterium]
MENDIILFMLIGAVSQLVDGMLGMGFGTISSSLLLTMGIHPRTSSSLIHTAEIFTSGTAALSHIKLKNVRKKTVAVLALYGSLGGLAGALLLTNVPTNWIKPFVAFYLLFLGISIIHKYFRLRKKGFQPFEIFPLRLVAQLLNKVRLRVPGGVKPLSKIQLGMLGITGGTLDAVGGGGWGAIVNTSLISKGQDPHKSIGSSCVAEFFVTLTTSIALFSLTESFWWQACLGLVLGGVIMAPISAILCKKISSHVFLLVIGVLVTLLSINTLVNLGIDWYFLRLT